MTDSRLGRARRQGGRRKAGDNFSVERTLLAGGWSCIAGLDEAGRGPLAGPVVAACVILPPETVSSDYRLLRDSKVLSPKQRESLYALLQEMGAVIGIGSASSREIERLNILQASLLAMKRALDDCTGGSGGQAPDFLLVDGSFPVPAPVRQQPLVKGESRSASIAAASIVAKVIRDRVMAGCHLQYPDYGFLHNHGYPTPEHRQAIRLLGPCPLHRTTFKGVREYVAPPADAPPLHQRCLW